MTRAVLMRDVRDAANMGLAGVPDGQEVWREMSGAASIWDWQERPALEVYLLGLVELGAAVVLQERFVSQIHSAGDRRGALLLCEHPPAVTLGRESPLACFADRHEDLIRRQVSIQAVRRGGGCVVHAPGQLAIYPIIPLDRWGLSVLDFRRRVEAALIASCEELHAPAWVDAHRPGIWCRGGKLAEVGLSVRHSTSCQGVFLNVTPWRDWLTRACLRMAGSVPQSFLAAQRSRPTPMSLVRESMIRHMAEHLGYSRMHLYSQHPKLKRGIREVAYA